VGTIIELFGLPNPAAEGFAVVDGDMSSSTAALYGLSMLHTLFNTINTLILIWFIKLIEKAVVWMIKPKSQDKEPFRLKYISAGPLATPELAAEQAFDEIIHFAQISRNGLGYAKQAIAADTKQFEELREKLVKYEEISDRIEYEIAAFLNGVSAGDISEATSMKIKAMYKIIGELESLGDSGEAISRMLSRRNEHKKTFSAETIDNINLMLELVDGAYDVMIVNLIAAHEGTLSSIANAYSAEEQINVLRNELREAEIEALEDNQKNYQTSVYYIDIINELEHMGDYMINISQSLERAFVEE
jgi:phosphate:Na+ symporter